LSLDEQANAVKQGSLAGRFLLFFLLFTGIATFLVIQHPIWVTIGIFLLIVPGLMLAMLPSFFMWLFSFSVLWSWMRFRVRPEIAIPVAIAITALIFFTLGRVVQKPGEESYQKILATQDITPSQRLELSGDILLSVPHLSGPDFDPEVVADYRRRVEAYQKQEQAEAKRQQAEFERQEKERSIACAKPCPTVVQSVAYRQADPPSYPPDAPRSWPCDALCAALLTTKGVDSVTVDSHDDADQLGGPTAYARTFRLMPKGKCPATTVALDNPGGLDLGSGEGSVPRAGNSDLTLDEEWQIRLFQGACVVASAPLATHDFAIAHYHYSVPRKTQRRTHKPNPWSLAVRPVEVNRLVITDRSNKILLRQTYALSLILSRPLSVGIESSGWQAEFGWNREKRTNRPRYWEFHPSAILAQYSSLYTGGDTSLSLRKEQGS
jgi:hypothetical protein